MPGFNEDEPRDPMGRWTTGLSTATQKAASDKFTVGYAPFRVGNIADIGNTKAFDDEKFKQWREQGTQLANLMGIRILGDNNTIGIYEATTDNAETSRVIEIAADERKATQYAAIMGAIAPDKQMSVMLNKYQKGGDASENYINFKSKDAAINFVKNRKAYGINDLSYAPDKNQVLILDFGDFQKEKFLKDHGQQIASIKEREVKTRFIGEDEYGDIVREVRNTIRERNGGGTGKLFDSFLTQAEKRTQKILTDAI
jgi:hypothetical protein